MVEYGLPASIVCFFTHMWKLFSADSILFETATHCQLFWFAATVAVMGAKDPRTNSAHPTPDQTTPKNPLVPWKNRIFLPFSLHFYPPPPSFPTPCRSPGGGGVTWSTQNFPLRLIVLLCG